MADHTTEGGLEWGRGMPLKHTGWWPALLLLLLLPWAGTAGACCGKEKLDRVNRRLSGHVVDYTHNHGADRRIWSPALNEWRDLYVYLPPGYDPSHCYPLVLWLHGFLEGEQSFLNFLAEPLDCAIAAGKLPPVIVAAPDGNVSGRPNPCGPVSFFLNSKVGKFEDYVI